MRAVKYLLAAAAIFALVFVAVVLAIAVMTEAEYLPTGPAPETSLPSVPLN